MLYKNVVLLSEDSIEHILPNVVRLNFVKENLTLEAREESIKHLYSNELTVILSNEPDQHLLEQSAYAMKGNIMDIFPWENYIIVSFGGLIGKFPIKDIESSLQPEGKVYLYIKPAIS